MTVPASTAKLRRLDGAAANHALVKVAAKAHLTIVGASFVVLALVGWFLARWIGSRSMFVLVYAFLLAMMLSWLVSRRKLAINVERSALPTRMREGQTGQVVLTVKARRRASTLVIEELLPEAFGRPARLPLAAITPDREVEHSYSFTPARRGVYALGPAVATWSDPFGLTTQRQQLADAVPMIVHPSTELVHDRVLARMWEDPPMRPPFSRPWPVGFEFYGMRDYVPGDDMRRVVWNAVAKTGRMLVRESEQGITDRISIVLDTCRQWHSPGEVSATFELAVKVAASVGAKHLSDGLAVSFASNDARIASSLRGPRARTTLLDALAGIQMTGTPLASIGGSLLADARQRCHFVVVTPHLDKVMTQRLRLVLEKGASVVIVKVVWEESEPASLARAASLGCQVVQMPVDTSIERAFTHQIGAGIRR